MAEAKPTNNKNRTRRRLLLSLLAVAVIVVLAVVTAPKRTTPKYRRYVGPPLPDGSRVTFLYPANMTHFPLNKSVIGPSLVQDEQLVEPLSLRESILLNFPFWERLQLADDLTVGVVVTDVTQISYVPSGTTARGRFEQQSTQNMNNGRGRTTINYVSPCSAKNQLDFNFEYQYLVSSTPPAAFAEHKATITRSFQVLPPGAAVPTP